MAARSETVTAVDGTCPACAAQQLGRMSYPSTVERWRDLAVLVCGACGFGYVPKVDFDLDAYYASTYGESHGRRNLKPRFFKTIDQADSKKIKRSRGHAKMLLEKAGPIDSVLDIGSGPGFFLHYVDAKRKYAIESDQRSQAMLKALGATVVTSVDEVEDLDAIVMSHVLEHFLVDQYRDYLKSAATKLKPGGLFIIEVPEWPHIDKKWTRPNGKGHEPHTMFFSRTALVNALDEELIYFHDSTGTYPVEDGNADWSRAEPRPKFPSSMLAIWRRRG